MFNRNGSTVSLKSQNGNRVSTPKEVFERLPRTTNEILNDTNVLEKILMNEKNYKDAAIIDDLVPDDPGLYCLRIKDISKLPKPFNEILSKREHNIIYIGIASQSLNRRCLNQELRANGHGTFFRSIGAILGFKPLKGSLLIKANKKNYTFSRSDEEKVIAWINKYLKVNWVKFNGDLDAIETSLIQKYLPLLNLAKNPASLKELTDLRAECVKIANSK